MLVGGKAERFHSVLKKAMFLLWSGFLMQIRIFQGVARTLTMRMPQHIVRADDADLVRMLIDDIELIHIQRQQLLDDGGVLC
jgi:hypothetical protein